MKNKFKFIICILFLSLVSCDKEEKFENDINGIWELRHVKGGPIAWSPNYPPGNGKIIKITGNTYQRIDKGAVISSSTFAIINTKIEIDGTKFFFKLDFDQPRDLDVYAKIEDNKLILSAGSMISDLTTNTYERL